MELNTEFISYHRSGNDLHLRTSHQIVFVSKEDSEMIQLAKTIQRGQKILVEGESEFSNTLSNIVVRATKIKII